MFKHTCNLILMSFCFYKSYQRIIRQHLYVNIKYIPMKNTTTYFNTLQWKHNSIVRLHHNVSITLHHLCFNKICTSPWHWIVKFFKDVRCYTIPCFSHSLPPIFFLHDIQLPISLLLYSKRCQWDSCLAKKIPWQFQEGYFYHSRNVLVLLELWHGVRSCIKIYPFCRNTTPSHVISKSWIIYHSGILHYP